MLKWFRQRKERKQDLQWSVSRARILEPLNGTLPTAYLALPQRDMVSLATAYVAAMEIQNTKKWCRCEWIIHPGDTLLPEGNRRVRMGEPAPDCPIHTKEGFLLYFLEWVFTHDAHD